VADRDWRLTRERLEAEQLPLELEAYDYYPEGVHIPVSWAGCIIVTDPWESDKPVETYCTLGVYGVQMETGDNTMIDLKREELAPAVITLMTEFRHDDQWLTRANEQIARWFLEGKG